MKAALKDRVVAESGDIIEFDGYRYFPAETVRRDWLQKAAKTESDLRCPHGVQFYDLVVDGTRHERAAWSYEAPQAKLKHIGGRFGFWGDVEVR